MKKRSLVEITLHEIHFWQKVLSKILRVKACSFISTTLKTETTASLIQATVYKMIQQWHLDLKCCLLSCRKWLYSTYLVLDTACGNWKILLVSAPFQLNAVLYTTEKPKASLSAVRMLVDERHHYLQGIFCLQNVNCCWNSHQQPCFLIIVQF